MFRFNLLTARACLTYKRCLILWFLINLEWKSLLNISRTSKFDFMISYQPWVKTHPVPQRFFWRQLAWRQFFRSHLRARPQDRSRLKSWRYPIFFGFLVEDTQSLWLSPDLCLQVGKHVLPTGSFVQVRLDKSACIYQSAESWGVRENLYCLIFWVKITVYAQVSLYGLHRNVPHWGDPENFRPERFLLDGKVVQVDVFFFFTKVRTASLS